MECKRQTIRLPAVLPAKRLRASVHIAVRHHREPYNRRIMPFGATLSNFWVKLLVGHRTASDGETPGYSARSAALSATQPVAAITRCPHMNFAKTARRSSQRSNFLLRHRTPGEVTSPKPLTSSWTVSSLNVKRDTHDSSIGRGDSPLDTKVQSLYRMLTMQMS